jgi:hypothetical protein
MSRATKQETAMHVIYFATSVVIGMTAIYFFGVVPLMEQIQATMQAVALAR